MEQNYVSVTLCIENLLAQKTKKEFLYRVVRSWSNGNVVADHNPSVKSESRFAGKKNNVVRETRHGLNNDSHSSRRLSHNNDISNVPNDKSSSSKYQRQAVREAQTPINAGRPYN